MDDFAAVLSQFDRVILLPIYPARELPIAGVTSQALAKKIDSITPVEVLEKAQIKDIIAHLPQRIKVVLGAGDIGLELSTLKEKLEQNETV